MNDREVSNRARRLAAALEPVAGQVYFSPECHEAYHALGFDPSPMETFNGVQVPDGAAYFTSRGSVMGQVPGELVAAAFAVFNPEVVVPLVSYGWTLTALVGVASFQIVSGTGGWSWFFTTLALFPAVSGMARTVPVAARLPIVGAGAAVAAATLVLRWGWVGWAAALVGAYAVVTAIRGDRIMTTPHPAINAISTA